jgi:hypothetical protein
VKLMSYGPRGSESHGILDEEGRLRDLSAHTRDIGGAVLLPEQLAKLRALDTADLPRVDGILHIGFRLVLYEVSKSAARE